MNGLIILSAIAGLPALLLILLRANASVGFLSLSIGSMLVANVAADATDMLSSFSPHSHNAIDQAVRAAFIVLPFLLTLVFTRKSVNGGKMIFNIIVALFVGVLFSLIIVPMLPNSLQNSIYSQSVWHQVSSLQTMVVLVGSVSSLFMLYATARAPHESKKKSHH